MIRPPSFFTSLVPLHVRVCVPESQHSFAGTGPTLALHKQRWAKLSTEPIKEDKVTNTRSLLNDTPSFNFHGLICVLAEQGRPPRWRVGLVVGG